MREITDHRTGLNDLDALVRIDATDDVDTSRGESHARYQFYLRLHNSWEKAGDIRFQKGPYTRAKDTDPPAVPNGITTESLIAVCVDRLRVFQSGTHSCRENAIAITKLEEALLWLKKRTADRVQRGVEGTRTP